MTAYLECIDGIYHVVAYVCLPNERYAQYHTLRAFREQGDAQLFKLMVNNRMIDGLAYVRTYKEGTVVTSMQHGKLAPKLRFENV